MSEVDVVIEQGLPEALREQAVELFEEAFGPKMRMAISEPEKRMAFLRRAYVASHVVIARDDDRLLGMAGLSTNGEPYAGGLLDVSWDPRPYRDLLGWAGAAWAVWNLRLGNHSPTADELYVDGIAVVPEARGRGVGTRLLEEINRIARRQGKRFVRLEVVDTNPRAQALYERVGYRVTRVRSFHWEQRRVGFGATISMEQPVAPPEPERPAPVPATARRQL